MNDLTLKSRSKPELIKQIVNLRKKVKIYQTIICQKDYSIKRLSQHIKNHGKRLIYLSEHPTTKCNISKLVKVIK